MSAALRPYAPEPSAELREAFHRGERRAIGELASLFYADLVRFARSLAGGDDRVAEEAVQDAFLCILERHGLYEPARPLRPWLFGVCRNCCREALRARAKEERAGHARIVSMDELREAGAPDPPDEAATTALEELIRREEERAVMDLLGELPEPSRAVVVLRLFEGFAFAEAARILGEPQTTVSNRYYRALDKLRELREARRADQPRAAAPKKGGSLHA